MRRNPRLWLLALFIPVAAGAMALGAWLGPAPQPVGPVRGVVWELLDVVDGDTVVARVAPGLPAEKVRVAGVDTAERGARARCPAEAELAEKATAFTAAFLASGEVRFVARGREKYGRLLAEVYVGGRSLSGELIAAGLGRPYRGERRLEWC